MCGIVGYLGPQNPVDIIINGLKKLEYRGYDSAGLAIYHQGKFKRIRAEGKLKNLEEKVRGEKFEGHLGIGHTRWATHGVPSERNAHPHQVDGISLVHNGIIENYQEIKEDLLSRGAKILSETDSELVAHLLAAEVKVQKDLFKAVLATLKKLRGAFSILAIWDQEPNTLVAFKDGPPLVVGLGKGQNFVVSDVQAAIAHTSQFVFLEDREVVVLKGEQVSFFNSEGLSIKKHEVTLNPSSQQSEKMGFSHFMLKEIFEQPQSVAAALEPHIKLETHEVCLNRLGFGGTSLQDLDKIDAKVDLQRTYAVFEKIQKIVVVGCGTSFYAGMVGKYLIENLAQISVEIDIASEFRYRKPVLTKDSLVLTISQSGETADTLAAIRMAKQQGVQTLSLCNVRNSSIDREAHGHMYMNCGPEVGVASTKAFVATLTNLNLIAIALAKAKSKITAKAESQMVRDLLALPSQIEVVLAYDKYFDQASESLKSDYKGFLYMARGINYPIALEGALKLKELAYLHAEGYAAGEMKHGPLALIDDKMAVVMIVPDDDLFEKTLSNLEEAKARGGYIISIGTGENEKLKRVSKRYLGLPKVNWTSNPILAVIPLQLMAFHLAAKLGYDVDQPRNLAKSVTVE